MGLGYREKTPVTLWLIDWLISVSLVDLILIISESLKRLKWSKNKKNVKLALHEIQFKINEYLVRSR